MAKVTSRDAQARGERMSLERRLSNYSAAGRASLTPRQVRRAAHKAKVSTDEVREQQG